MSTLPKSAEAADRRVTPRFSTELPGKVFPGAVDCVIIDLSAGGARLRMATPCRTGDDVLVVEWESGRAHDGQVVWMHDDEVGVRFIRSCFLQGRIPTPFIEAKLAWEATQAQAGDVP